MRYVNNSLSAKYDSRSAHHWLLLLLLLAMVQMLAMAAVQSTTESRTDSLKAQQYSRAASGAHSAGYIQHNGNITAR